MVNGIEASLNEKMNLSPNPRIYMKLVDPTVYLKILKIVATNKSGSLPKNSVVVSTRTSDAMVQIDSNARSQFKHAGRSGLGPQDDGRVQVPLDEEVRAERQAEGSHRKGGLRDRELGVVRLLDAGEVLEEALHEIEIALVLGRVEDAEHRAGLGYDPGNARAPTRGGAAPHLRTRLNNIE